jgi:2-polyprenyl-3-methyl-5-hydroxy-6-metoxy-1,4-benzoquinol methylase
MHMMNANPIAELTEKASCPICGSDEYEVIQPAQYPTDLSRTELLKVYQSSSDTTLMDQLVSCKGCTLKYLNPRVRSDLILESYSNAVDPTFIKQNPQRIATFKRAFGKVLKRLQITPSRETRVLDVGCAGGAFPKAADDLGFSVVGVEPSAWMCEFGKKEYGLDLRPGIIQDQKFDDKTFDIVTLWDVIEHIVDPVDALQHIRRVLKDSGYLVVNYPDYDSIACKMMGKRWPFFLSVHLYYFTPQTVRQILEKAGFEVIDLWPFFQTLQLGYVSKRASHYVPGTGWVESALKALKADQIPFTYNLGQSLVIARKKG